VSHALVASGLERDSPGRSVQFNAIDRRPAGRPIYLPQPRRFNENEFSRSEHTELFGIEIPCLAYTISGHVMTKPESPASRRSSSSGMSRPRCRSTTNASGSTSRFRGPIDDIFFGIVQRGAAMTMLKDVGVDPLPNHARDVENGCARWDAYLHVPDPDALAAEFSSRNVEFSRPLEDDDNGLRGFELEDASACET
jgi:hypothetical protein